MYECVLVWTQCQVMMMVKRYSYVVVEGWPGNGVGCVEGGGGMFCREAWMGRSGSSVNTMPLVPHPSNTGHVYPSNPPAHIFSLGKSLWLSAIIFFANIDSFQSSQNHLDFFRLVGNLKYWYVVILHHRFSPSDWYATLSAALRILSLDTHFDISWLMNKLSHFQSLINIWHSTTTRQFGKLRGL